MGSSKPPSELVVAFMDVGQGDATVLLLPDGESAIVVDCPSGQDRVVLDFLDHARIRTLELVVATHSDADHIGGIPDLIMHFMNDYGGSVSHVIFSPDRHVPLEPEKQQQYRRTMHRLIDQGRQGIRTTLPFNLPNMVMGDVTVSVLHPSDLDYAHAQTQALNMRNEISIVLRIEYQGERVLLGADVQGQGWQWMQDRGEDLRARVFKFPHHGAQYSGGLPIERILDAVSPDLVVISVGSLNTYEHPDPETLGKLAERARLRFVCTQVTERCHPNVMRKADEVRRLLPMLNRGGASWRSKRSCPCAGTVMVHVSATGIVVHPTVDEHNRIIDLFNTPRCRC